jgi:hypothetical protein
VPVSGAGFTANKTVTLSYYLGGTLKKQWTVTAASDGTFSTSFTPGLLDTGSASIAAVDTCSRSASRSFTIIAGL